MLTWTFLKSIRQGTWRELWPWPLGLRMTFGSYCETTIFFDRHVNDM